MGLDIYFSRFKRDKYAEFCEKNKVANKNLKDLETKLHEKYGAGFDRWSEEDRKRYADLYDKCPSEKDYGKEIGYFRKVNFLLPFFGYEENTTDFEVSLQQVKDLKDACEQVLAHKGEDDHYYAKKLLPTASGFFFGSTDYNDYYYDDVKAVGEWADKVVDETSDDDIIIMYCWW